MQKTGSALSITVLKIVLAVALLAGAQAPSSAISSCENFNSVDFFSNADVELVQRCLNNGASLHDEDSSGLTPLFHAVKGSKDLIVIDRIFEHARDNDIIDSIQVHTWSGMSIAHYAAAEAEDPAIITRLSKNGVDVADIELLCSSGFFSPCGRPIHDAARRRDGFLYIATLLALGANGEALDQDDLSVKEIIEELEEDRLDKLSLLATDNWRETLDSHGFQSSMETNGVSNPSDCSNFLSEAFFATANLELVDSCLSSGSNPLAVDRDANTAIHIAAKATSDPRIIDHLLVHIDTDNDNDTDRVSRVLGQTNHQARTPLHLAAESNDSAEVVARLIAWGSDVNARLSEGTGHDTPIHLAARREGTERVSVLTVLLALGADLRLTNRNGFLAIHFAAIHQPEARVISLLQQADRSADSLFRRLASLKGNDDNLSALHYAVEQDADLDTIKLMTDFGFSPDEKSSADIGSVTPLLLAAGHVTRSEVFFHLLSLSEKPCYQGEQGITLEGMLGRNTNLTDYDVTGEERSPLSVYKERCPN